VQIGAVQIYVAAALEAPKKNERGDETQFTTKIGGTTSLGPSYYFVLENFIPNYAFDALLCRKWPFSPRLIA
jgi:hypothetical protein